MVVICVSLLLMLYGICALAYSGLIRHLYLRLNSRCLLLTVTAIALVVADGVTLFVASGAITHKGAGEMVSAVRRFAEENP